MSEVGKKLEDLYEAMRSEYGRAEDKAEGSRRALEIYAANRVYMEDLKILIGDIEDFVRIL